ncbi:MAG: type III polyketide synthase [Cyclobacteriaceae bacterium]
MTSIISSIGTATPEHHLTQKQISSFMAEALEMDEDQRHQLEVLYRASGIQSRYSVLPDFGAHREQYEFFSKENGLEPFPTVGDRMNLYQREALPLAVKAIADMNRNLDGITHLVTVSCTGMYAPGLDIQLIEELDLPTTIHRTAINYMGCYAAFNALKLADSFCQNNSTAKVLIVCLELCSIHFQKHNDEDTMLANALFGDGAAAVMVESKSEGLGLSLEHFHCDIVPSGKKDMAWQISDFGFEMKLSSYVPEIIKGGIHSLTKSLLGHLGMARKDIDLFAIHPGGKRILQVIEEELSMSKEDNQHAYDVLRECGNMSSPTVLFVLRQLMNSLSEGDQDKNILSFAFGPGLTLESMLLKVKC